MPNQRPPLAYPDCFEVCSVSANGGICWNRQWVNVSITCVGEYAGLEDIDDGVWNVPFGPLELGQLRHGSICRVRCSGLIIMKAFSFWHTEVHPVS